jgi:hypothetical protein
MAEKIQVVVDVNTESVKIATDRTLTLQQQLKVLKRELQTVPEGTQEWNLINAKFNDTKDALDRVNVKSRELFGTLQLIPGPIGTIASKVNGAIDLFKVFSSFKMTDIRAAFKAFGDDLKAVGSTLGNLTGITKAFNTTATAIEGGLNKIGIAGKGAANSAKLLTGAIAALGVGVAVIGISKLVEAYNSLNNEQKVTNQLAEETSKIVAKQIVVLDELDIALKDTTLTDKEKDDAVKKYNETLGGTLGQVKNWIELEEKLKSKLPEYKDYLLKRAEAEAISMLIQAETARKIQAAMADPASMAGFLDVVSRGGILGLFIEGRKGIGETIQKETVSKADKTIAALYERLNNVKDQLRKGEAGLNIRPDQPQAPKPKGTDKVSKPDQKSISRKFDQFKGDLETYRMLNESLTEIDTRGAEIRKSTYESTNGLILAGTRDLAVNLASVQSQVLDMTAKNSKDMVDIYLAESNARNDIRMAEVDNIQTFGSLLQQVAGNNKSLAIAGIIIEQGAAIGKVLIDTARGISAAQATAAPLLTNPFTMFKATVNLARTIAQLKISAAISAAAIVAGAAKGIAGINRAQIPGDKGGGGGGGGGGATPSFSGTPPMPAPQIGATVGQQGTIAGIVAGSIQANQSTSQPIRAYVVGNEIRTNAQLERRTRTMARLGG